MSEVKTTLMGEVLEALAAGNVALVLPDLAAVAEARADLLAAGLVEDAEAARLALGRYKLRLIQAGDVAPQSLRHFNGRLVLHPGLGRVLTGLWAPLQRVLAARHEIRTATRAHLGVRQADLEVLRQVQL